MTSFRLNTHVGPAMLGRFASISLLGFLLLANLGCDTSGIHPIGRVLDTTISCDTSTPTSSWLRSMVDGGEVIGTEVLLLGWRPHDPADQGLDTSTETTERCMTRFKIWGSTTTEEHLGAVALNGDGTGTMTENQHCSFHMQPDREVLNRRGANCFDLVAIDAVETMDFSFQMNGDVLEMTYPEDESPLFAFDQKNDGTSLADEMNYRIPAGTYRYKNSNQLAAELWAVREDPGMDREIWRLYHINLVTSQARIRGFGAGGMTQYLDSEATFIGLVSESFDVVVRDLFAPRTTITYPLMEDLPGMIMGSPEGDEQVTIVDLQGNGGMEGGVSFELQPTVGDSSTAITGYVSYEMTRVNDGFGNGGNFEITVDGSSYDTVAREIDVDDAMGYDVMEPGYGRFRFDTAVLDPNL